MTPADHETRCEPMRDGALPRAIFGDGPRSPRRTGTLSPMCRSIKTLRHPDEPATDDEIHAAALQFVRKISGYRQPSRANEVVFDAAVEEIAAVSRQLLNSLVVGRRSA